MAILADWYFNKGVKTEARFQFIKWQVYHTLVGLGSDTCQLGHTS